MQPSIKRLTFNNWFIAALVLLSGFPFMVLTSCSHQYASYDTNDTSHHCQHKHTDLGLMGLKGHVRSVVFTEYDIIYAGGAVRTPRIQDTNSAIYNWKAKRSFVFDTDGCIIEEKTFDKEENVLSAKINLFDSMHNEIQVSESTKDEYSKALNYYEGSRLVKKDFYANDIYSGCERLFYDSKGNLVRSDSYSKDSVLFSYDIYKYDTANNRIEELSYYVGETTPNEITKYEYDIKNWRIAKIMADYESERYNYNRAGLLKKEIVEVHGKRTAYYYTYDQHENCIEAVTLGWNGAIDETKSAYYAYKYDTAGNWVQKKDIKVIIDKMPVKLTKAEITYY